MGGSYDREAILQRDDYTCQRCGETFRDGRPLEVSHDVPRSQGGSDQPDNLESLCIGCHAAKDGWRVGDFGDDANRVHRTASYVRHVERLRGAAFVSRVGRLLGVDYDEASELLDRYL